MIPGRKWQWVMAVAASLAAGAGGIVIWNASQALHLAKRDIESEREFPFTASPYVPPQENHFEPVGSPEAFHRLARLRGNLYIAGPGGLSEYDSRGALLREFPVGTSLPGSSIVDMEAGQLVGATHPELLLATADQGILAFDGQRFRQILPANPEARAVTAILPASRGKLLIGTKKRGVLLYDGTSIRELHSTLDHLHVRALAGSETDLWVGTLDQGLKHWHAGTTESFGEEQGLPDRQVQAIAFAGDRTYVGTPLGVAEFDGGRFSRVLAKGALVTSLHFDKDELLVGTEDQGVRSVPLAAGHRLPARGTLPAAQLDEVQQIVGTEDGVLVLARNGVYQQRTNGLGWQQVLVPRRSVITDRNVSALAIDRDGRLWVGYFDRGLDVLPAAPGRAQHIENDHVFCVNRILPDARENSIEVATANGLVRFAMSGRPEQILGRADGLIADHVTDIAPYRDGLAVATPAGITFLDSEGARSMYSFHGLVNNHVYALGVSGDELLTGTLGGLSMLQKGFVKANFTAGNSGLKQNWITAVARVGDEWMIGTYGSGVMGLDEAGRIHPYEIATAPVAINPNAMLATKEHVFVGTLGHGLYVYDRVRQRWAVLQDGLPSQNVTAFAAGHGFVYVGTDNGLVRIQENQILP
jgi:ligand-binding sensor domain-containing protein